LSVTIEGQEIQVVGHLKKIAYLGLVLVLTGCSSGTTSGLPSPGGSAAITDMTHQELVALENYDELLLSACEPDLLASVESMDFLTLAGMSTEGSTTPLDVMASRTERILNATGDETQESEILNEVSLWDSLEDSVFTTDWQTPTLSLRQVLDEGTSNLLLNFFEYRSPQEEAVDGVTADLLEACGIAEPLKKATEVSENYEQALSELQSSFYLRFTEMGFVDHGIALIKFSIEGEQAVFNFVSTAWCTAKVTVVFPGKTGQDGLGTADREGTFLLSHPQHFTQINVKEPIRPAMNADPKNYDLSAAEVTSVSCI